MTKEQETLIGNYSALGIYVVTLHNDYYLCEI